MYVHCTPNFHVRVNWIFNQFSATHWKTFRTTCWEKVVSLSIYQITDFEMGKERNQGRWSFIYCDVACPSAPTGGLFNTWRLFDKVDKSFQNKRPQNQIGGYVKAGSNSGGGRLEDGFNGSVQLRSSKFFHIITCENRFEPKLVPVNFTTILCGDWPSGFLPRGSSRFTRKVGKRVTEVGHNKITTFGRLNA